MNLVTAISCACVAAISVSSANAGLVFGTDAHDQFADLQLQLNEGFNDFESVGTGTDLNPGANPFGDGVNFASIISTSGNPFGPFHVEVSGGYGPGTFGNTIVGSPCDGCGDDGRVGYEITFDSAQRRAGLLRLWNNSSLTSFYNVNGDLLGTHQITASQQFVGWMADSNDESTWVSRIVMDGLDSGGSRQVGYSDDLYFGTQVPAPAGSASLALLGFGCAMRRRR